MPVLCAVKLLAESHLDQKGNRVYWNELACLVWPLQSWSQTLHKSVSSFKTQPRTCSLTCRTASPKQCFCGWESPANLHKRPAHNSRSSNSPTNMHRSMHHSCKMGRHIRKFVSMRTSVNFEVKSVRMMVWSSKVGWEYDLTGRRSTVSH